VLPTKDFALQTDDLDRSDLAAVWALLHAYKQTKMMVIYNCGVNSGSSQGHKHLQLFPYPSGYELWPSKAVSASAGGRIISNVPGVPFVHFLSRMPASKSDTSPISSLVSTYEKLLTLTKAALASTANGRSQDYNVALTKDWIVLIPRMTAGPDGPWGSNAAGMLGMVGIRDRRELEWWGELGYKKYLAWLGIPIDGEWNATYSYESRDSKQGRSLQDL
jgi:sulfate adenylyltransferase (ADP) / ATP adenylyltransferase